MDIFIAQAQWNGYRVNSVPINHVIDARPEPEFPPNHRAQLMSDLWCTDLRSEQPGVLWLTCDVALDPGDLAAMARSIAWRPADVHTGLVKLWPTSTGRPDWMWSHRTGTIEQPAATQDETAPCVYFTIDCVWTPARLLDAAFPAISGDYFSQIDLSLSRIAHGLGIVAHLVPGCRPKHLHF